ncbi:response regulator [Salinithrix halophila]|uniref:Transcriptional regulatory protein n=1 Tax=Salinithrix halophila TaxID=1485204 RepID=A0ABV8JCW8_9BACL
MDGPLEVLIVEDDQRIAEINRRFTERVEGFTVAGTAHNGEEAREWLEVLQPQLVLLDIYLPDMKGIDLIWHIRRYYKNTDIILITAAGETDVVQEAMRGGVIDYIVKPIAFDRFRRSLDNYRDYRRQLERSDRMDQGQIDRLWTRANEGAASMLSKDPELMPKGIDPITLKKVTEVFEEAGEGGLTAEEVGKEIGASRSTARRYLEYLVSCQSLKADVSYGAVGRPERRYFSQGN